MAQSSSSDSPPPPASRNGSSVQLSATEYQHHQQQRQQQKDVAAAQPAEPLLPPPSSSSATPAPDDDAGDSKRRRIARACDQCRKKKVFLLLFFIGRYTCDADGCRSNATAGPPRARTAKTTIPNASLLLSKRSASLRKGVPLSSPFYFLNIYIYMFVYIEANFVVRNTSRVWRTASAAWNPS